VASGRISAAIESLREYCGATIIKAGRLQKKTARTIFECFVLLFIDRFGFDWWWNSVFKENPKKVN
jgi:hypothetical protein